MILNEDYFKDLEINDEDFIEDDINDVDEPKQELTLDDIRKLPEQYGHYIVYNIQFGDVDTSVLSRTFKRLDSIFEMYNIEHSEYILSTEYSLSNCDTAVEFEKYQVFCEDRLQDRFINNTYEGNFYIYVYLNYPKFSYKRAMHFVYTTVYNIIKINKDLYFLYLIFRSTTEDNDIDFLWKYNYFLKHKKLFHCYGLDSQYSAILSNDKVPEEDKIRLYKFIIRYFFGKDVKIDDYKALERDVPFIPFKL